jgi:hypothetical protein
VAHLPLQQDPQVPPGDGRTGHGVQEVRRRGVSRAGQGFADYIQAAADRGGEQVFFAPVVPVDRGRGEPDRGGQVGHRDLVKAEAAELPGGDGSELGAAFGSTLPGTFRLGDADAVWGHGGGLGRTGHGCHLG